MVKERPIQAFLLVGPTAAGKTPLGDVIMERGVHGRRCIHFDFGSELRSVAALERNQCDFTESEVFFIRRVLDEGLLLEDRQFSLAKKIFHAFVGREGIGEGDIVVLNGLPRHEGQADDMSDIVDITTLIVLECSKENILCRIDRDTGGDRSQRVDDHHDLVMKKIDIYTRRTAPLIAYYERKGARVMRLEVTAHADARSVYHDFLNTFARIHS